MKHTTILVILLLTHSLLVKATNYPRVKESCISNAQCFTDFEYCAAATTDQVSSNSNSTDSLLTGTCKHKDVWELETLEWVGCISTFVILFISNCGGLGGGGALIPIAIVFFGFDTK